MKYFLDTEFIEGSQPKKLLGITYGETKPTIDLISIGIVDENGAEYYAISKDFNVDDAWDRFDMKEGKKVYWIRQNVLMKIYTDLVYGDARNYIPFTKSSFKSLIKGHGKPNSQIAFEILQFICDRNGEGQGAMSSGEYFRAMHAEELNDERKPEFWAYYCSYDWVVFCQLFGKMIDLPKSFPMYCQDLKILMDFCGLTKEWKKEHCPEPVNAHNALVDAKWNISLYSVIEDQFFNHQK